MSSEDIVDIDVAFDNIFLSEEINYDKGYQEGTIRGKDEGFKNGLIDGYRKGKEIGEELGEYYGTLYTHLIFNRHKESAKKIKFVEDLLKLIENALASSEGSSKQITISEIRQKYKQVYKIILKDNTNLKTSFKNHMPDFGHDLKYTEDMFKDLSF
ncbi:unnamed protein product [Gordionus sp. m RMFG-2023]|uniref:protein LTO1 homolog n=1 Tax=Gordionus sp. m RMFG-2023 TaxID=3053472 RepID=UPI0030E4FFC9